VIYLNIQEGLSEMCRSFVKRRGVIVPNRDEEEFGVLEGPKGTQWLDLSVLMARWAI
jgi:hypothetical protein